MYSYLYMAQPSTIKSGNKINDTAPIIPQQYSTFPLSYRFFQTQQYAHITPHLNFKSQEGFSDTFRAMAETSTLSLNAPLKSDVYQKRSNYFVPLQAILPRNWEYITVQPTNGDDVADQVNGVVSGQQMRSFLNKFCSRVSNLIGDVESGNDLSGYIGNLIRNILILEMFCSQGSLCKQLRYDFSHFFQAREYVTGHGQLKRVKPRSFDYFADKVLSAIAPKSADLTGIHLFEVVWWNESQEETDHYIVAPDGYLSTLPDRENTEHIQYISFDHFLDMARQNLNFNIYILDVSTSWNVRSVEVVPSDPEEESMYFLMPTETVIDSLFGDFYNPSLDAYNLQISISPATDFQDTYNFNYLSAYQIICAHFFSWDFVDYIYSANMYRELMQYYCDKIVTSVSQRVFNWNGLQFHYDSLSGYYINKAFVNCLAYGFSDPYTDSEGETYSVFNWGYCYLTSLFSFRHNLRYMDYFVGGRTRPLSVGNVGVAVSNNQVNAVDIVVQKNYAKWLNWSMRIGRKFSDYIKGKSKVEPRPDLHDPQWLSGTGDLIFAKNVQNTGAAQQDNPNSITSNLQSNTNRYQFKYMADRVGYIIGVTHYDIPRAYAFATGRDNYHANRYDDFNPMMQYDGSQAVYRSELGLKGSTPFSYQTKYSEYKQMYDIAAGGFVENLPGFTFIADTQSGVPMQQNLNPSYIRSWNEELTPFYLSMTGHVLAKRFNFIVVNTNIINAHRNMEYQPQLM